MTFSISKTQQFGDLSIATISKTNTTSFKGRHSSTFICQKRPVFVLLRQDERVTIVDMFGDPVSNDKIAAILPSALDVFIRQG